MSLAAAFISLLLTKKGFLITAAGLTDLATGEVLSPEGLGGEGTDTNVTIFNGDVIVNGELRANTIDSTQKALVFLKDNNSDQVSQGRGMAWIAPAEAIPDVSVADAAEFNTKNQEGTFAGPTNIGANGYSGPHFVTPYFLDLWKAKKWIAGQGSWNDQDLCQPKGGSKTTKSSCPHLRKQ